MIDVSAADMNLGTASSILIERDAEMLAVRSALTQARLGQGSGLLISGPAGIGKSRLITEATTMAGSAGMTVLRARGAELERDYPFGVVRQLLEAIALHPERGPRVFGGAGRSAGPVFLAEPEPTPAQNASFAVLNGLFWALASLSGEAPVLITVDDAQWADRPSLRFLEFLSRRLDEQPVALIVAFRPGSDAPADDGLRELTGDPRLETLQPAGLSLDGVTTMVTATFGIQAAPDFAAVCHRRTAGNPFLLVELLGECVSVGVTPEGPDATERVAALTPRTISTVVRARLLRLGCAEERLAEAVAILGDGAEFADAAALAGLPAGVAGTAAGALTRVGILSTSQRMEFAHPLLSTAILADAPAERAQRHADAARLLASRGRDPETVAAQVLLSPRAGNDWNVERLREAARVAVARAAPDVAVPLLRRALSEPPSPTVRAGVLIELGTAHATMHAGEAIHHLAEARDALPPGTERASVGLLLAQLLSLSGRTADTYSAISDARKLLGPEDRELALSLDATELNTTSIDPDGAARRQSLLRWGAALPGVTPAERAMLAATAFGLAQGLQPVSRVLDLVRRATGDGQWWFTDTQDPFTPLLLATVLHRSGRVRQSLELCDALIERAGLLGSAALFANASTARAHARWRAGNLCEAEADARRALARTSPPLGQTRALATQALVGILIDRGELDQAARALEALRVPPGSTDNTLVAIVECARARLNLAVGEHRAALAAATAAGRVLEAAGCIHPMGGEWRQVTALAHVGLGQRDQASVVLSRALAQARRSGGVYELGMSLRAAALVSQPVDLELLAEASSVVARSDYRLLQAEVLVDIGGALRRSGRRQESRAPLAEGMELADACGARPLVEKARVELLAAGSRPRRIQRSGIESLTPSEHRAASLAADGLSNREIAQQLFVSIRTVESQLRVAYQKLEIASRQELAGALCPTTTGTQSIT